MAYRSETGQRIGGIGWLADDQFRNIAHHFELVVAETACGRCQGLFIGAMDEEMVVPVCQVEFIDFDVFVV